jgi:hypothetical protein
MPRISRGKTISAARRTQALFRDRVMFVTAHRCAAP